MVAQASTPASPPKPIAIRVPDGVKLPIFMDNHSTTAVDLRVVQAMLPFFTQHYGNAASRNHHFGWEAEEAVDYARERIAKLIGAKDSKEIVLTSGATESDNLALKGVAEFYKDKGNHIITTVTEHKAILDTCKRLEKQGYEVTYLGVAKDGRVDPGDVKNAITDKTILVSIMAANNEISTLHPIKEIGKLCKKKGVLFHTDGVQAAGKIHIDVDEMGIDLLSMTPRLRVRSRGVVMRLKGAERDPREVGRELDVQVVVEGSVRRRDGGVRISARLISVADGVQLWAKRFDRPESELLQINDDTARAIADALAVELAPPVRDASLDVEATERASRPG